MADFLLLSSQQACLDVLTCLGLSSADAEKVRAWTNVDNRNVVLSFSASETCAFDRKAERKETGTKKYVTEYVTGLFKVS